MLPDAACLFIAEPGHGSHGTDRGFSGGTGRLGESIPYESKRIRAFVVPDAAGSILRLAFWDWRGALDRTEALTEIDAAAALTTAWDAAAVVDPSRRRVGFYAWNDFSESRSSQAAFCSLWNARNTDWNCRWLARGIEDVRGAFGETRPLVEEVRLIEEPAWNLLAADDEEPYWNDCWVTIKDAVGDVRHVTLSSLHGGVALLRPRHLPLMRRFAETLPEETEIRSGAWIDVAQREMILWDAQPQGYLEDHLRPFWQGWNVERQLDGWRLQAELAGERVPTSNLTREDVEAAAALLAEPAVGEATPAAIRALTRGAGVDAIGPSARWSSWSAAVAPDRKVLSSVVSTVLRRR